MYSKPFISFYRLEIKKKKGLYLLPGKALYIWRGISATGRIRFRSFSVSNMGGLSREGLRF
jgi:hypothetical protein